VRAWFTTKSQRNEKARTTYLSLSVERRASPPVETYCLATIRKTGEKIEIRCANCGMNSKNQLLEHGRPRPSKLLLRNIRETGEKIEIRCANSGMNSKNQLLEHGRPRPSKLLLRNIRETGEKIEIRCVNSGMNSKN